MWLINNPAVILVIILLMPVFTYSQLDSLQKKQNELITKSDTSHNKTNTPRQGRVVDQYSYPVADALVANLRTGIAASTNSKGIFIFKDLKPFTKLKITGADIITDTFYLRRERDIRIQVIKRLTPDVQTVAINTGYQFFKKNKNTSANFSVNQELFQQRVATNLAQRLEGIVPALLVTNNNTALNKPVWFSIGARTSLINPDPMIIINNFPLEGNLSNINPDDVEDITVLRDAAAIGIWGARAANGVLVIKTRSSKYIDRFRVSFNTSFSTTAAPDLFRTNRMSSTDHIFVDTTMFNTGFFDQIEKNRSRPPLSPVIEALYNKQLTPRQRLHFFDSLSTLDNRHDLKKYFYRRSFRQHFFIQCEGGGDNHNFYFSTGYDRINPELKLSREERKTTLFNFNTRRKGFELSVGISIAQRSEKNLNGIPEILQPYEMLVNSSNQPAFMPYQHRFAYIDTAGHNTLRDWKYYPLREFQLRDNFLTETDYRYDVALKYNTPAVPGLEAVAFLQQQVTNNRLREVYNKESFYSRDLTNSFTQVRPTELYLPVPKGNIADYYETGYNTINMRLQLGYTKKWAGNAFTVIAGKDHIVRRENYFRDRVYDYKNENGNGPNEVNYKDIFPMYYYSAIKLYVPDYRFERSIKHIYSSGYMNGLLRLKEKYDFSMCARQERSNLFGPLTNQRTPILLSAGFSWQISSERFYFSNWLPYIKLSANYGNTGNPPYKAIAQQTLSYGGLNSNGDPFAYFSNPPQYSLRWEKVNNLNLGINARTANDRIELSINWYSKTASNLVGYKALDPTSGNNSLTGNVGAMKSRNLDIIIESKNILRIFQWRTGFQLSIVNDRVTRAEDTMQQAWMYCDPEYFTTVKGRPLYGIFSFGFKGLDNQGNPLGEKGNKYTDMIEANGSSDLVYNGRATPGIFGSITNDFNYRQFNLSITLLYKLNYYYRRQSINYYNLFLGQSAGSADFTNRWQKAGDEKNTTVPSMPVSNKPNPARDLFYNYSSVLIEKADHVRLQNIQISYDLEGSALKKLQLRMGSFFLNCSNAGIIWRASQWRIDPDKLQGLPSPVLYTIGFRGTFK